MNQNRVNQYREKNNLQEIGQEDEDSKFSENQSEEQDQVMDFKVNHQPKISVEDEDESLEEQQKRLDYLDRQENDHHDDTSKILETGRSESNASMLDNNRLANLATWKKLKDLSR